MMLLLKILGVLGVLAVSPVIYSYRQLSQWIMVGLLRDAPGRSQRLRRMELNVSRDFRCDFVSQLVGLFVSDL